VAERPNAPVLKTGDLHGSGGSNPSASAVSELGKHRLGVAGTPNYCWSGVSFAVISGNPCSSTSGSSHRADCRCSSVRLTPVREAPVRSEPDRSASVRSAFRRSAPLRSAKVRIAWRKSACVLSVPSILSQGPSCPRSGVRSEPAGCGAVARNPRSSKVPGPPMPSGTNRAVTSRTTVARPLVSSRLDSRPTWSVTNNRCRCPGDGDSLHRRGQPAGHAVQTDPHPTGADRSEDLVVVRIVRRVCLRGPPTVVIATTEPSAAPRIPIRRIDSPFPVVPSARTTSDLAGVPIEHPNLTCCHRMCTERAKGHRPHRLGPGHVAARIAG
jgi:hypothetical protein